MIDGNKEDSTLFEFGPDRHPIDEKWVLAIGLLEHIDSAREGFFNILDYRRDREKEEEGVHNFLDAMLNEKESPEVFGEAVLLIYERLGPPAVGKYVRNWMKKNEKKLGKRRGQEILGALEWTIAE